MARRPRSTPEEIVRALDEEIRALEVLSVALAHPARAQILEMLSGGRTVSSAELVASVEGPRSTAQRALRFLVEAGLVVRCEGPRGYRLRT